MSDTTDAWNNKPLMTDQPEGFVCEETPLYILQTKQPEGSWEPHNTPREDRDEVTRIQAYYLTKDINDLGVRVLKRTVVWEVVEVPGYGADQTPPEEIMARNEEITKRLIDAEEARKREFEKLLALGHEASATGVIRAEDLHGPTQL